MNILREKIETFFTELRSDEALHVEEHENSILRALESAETLVNDYREQADSNVTLTDENALFRKCFADECRNTMLLIGDTDAGRRAEEIEFLSAEQIVDARDEILQQYDEQFIVRPRIEETIKSGKRESNGDAAEYRVR
ncbi:hypothetical protein ACFL67_03630 [candidate division KSB1 bacterium]